VSLGAFREDPWKTSHRAYADSVFNIRPAPEFATAEVMVASLYRSVGFPGLSERDVPGAGREFERVNRSSRQPDAKSGIGAETWRTVLHGVLESPKQPNQSSRRFLQLSPVVPDIALYSGSARLTGNSWNPGLLVQRMIQMGSDSQDAAVSLWGSVYDCLSIKEDDDIWARWLQGEFQRRKRGSGRSWDRRKMEDGLDWSEKEKLSLSFPARQFVKDLDAVLAAKTSMTRRQWISLVEAVVRLGAVAHVLWLCDINERIWGAIRSILEGEDAMPLADVAGAVVNRKGTFLEYGNPAVPMIRDYASRYLVARLGINLVLWHLDGIEKGSVPSLSSCKDLHQLMRACKDARQALVAADIMGDFNAIKDAEARTVACKKGIGSNLTEFGRHVLGQRLTNTESLRGYDQGYILRKRGEHKSSPWIVSLGPVAVLALTHCCLKDAAGPRSVQRLCAHLGLYGIHVDQDDVAKSDLGRKLRMLGLVFDSPDAESGMLLVPPFDALPTLDSMAVERDG
jgi:hypothetical protein